MWAVPDIYESASHERDSNEVGTVGVFLQIFAEMTHTQLTMSTS